MIAEAGLAALWFAAALAAVQLLLAAAAVRRGQAEVIAGVRPVAILQGSFAAIAMAALIAVFLASDMSVRVVVENSAAAKPWIYKFAGA
ncbi:hypothetical protein, partial [Clostridium perfringens]